MTTKTASAPTTKSRLKVVEIDRTFDLPVTVLWQAWTEPEHMKKWWGPKDFTCPYCAIDLKVGGRYLSCMLSSKGEEFWSTGVYEEIEPNKQLRFTDCFSDDKGNVISAKDLNMPGDWPEKLFVTVDFESKGEKTRMLIRQESIPLEAYEECIKGWGQSLDKLDRIRE